MIFKVFLSQIHTSNNKEWFDEECIKAKKSYLKVLKEFKIFKTEIWRERYSHEKKIYKQLVKRKRKQHHRKLIENIEILKSAKPKDF